VTILISDQVGSKDLVDYPQLRDVSVLDQVYSGDLCFSGEGPQGKIEKIAIEVKSIGDFAISARDGRLFDPQLIRMVEIYSVCWLLTYGNYKMKEDGDTLLYNSKYKNWRTLTIGNWDVPHSFLGNRFIECSEMGINCLHFPTKDDIATFSLYLYQWWNQPWQSHKFLRVFKSTVSELARCRETNSHILEIARVLNGLTGIGYTKGIAMAKHFGSLKEVINATPIKFQEVEGIGIALSKSLYKRIKRRIGDSP